MINHEEITYKLKFLEKIEEKSIFLQIFLTNLQKKKTRVIWEFLVILFESLIFVENGSNPTPLSENPIVAQTRFHSGKGRKSIYHYTCNKTQWCFYQDIGSYDSKRGLGQAQWGVPR